MKMKKLLLVVLTLAILTSLSAGTLAVYTSSQDLTQKAQAKKFYFNAAGYIKDKAEVIKLAPGGSTNYYFTVTNVDSTPGSVAAEVAMDYTINIDYSGAAADMSGLQARLLDKAGNSIGTFTNGKLTVKADSAVNERFTKDYNIELTWVDNKDNEVQTLKGIANAVNDSGLVVSVSAVQTGV